MNLYERDYSNLTEEEITIKEQLYEKYSFEKKSFYSIALVRELPKAVLHNNSLFPNNYLPYYDLRDSDTLNLLNQRFLEVLNNRTSTEIDIKRVIEDNRAYHIMGELLRYYSFGSRYLFKQFKLGTQYVPDYLLVGFDSEGHSFVWVEMECPYGNVVMKNGEFGEIIRKGISQIKEWKCFLESSFHSVSDEFEKYCYNKPLPKEFHKYDSTLMHFLVIAGRRSNFNDNTYRLARESKKDSGITITHYDKVYDNAKKLINDGLF